MKKGYLGKVVSPAVEAADGAIDKTIDAGSGAANKVKGAATKAKDTVKDAGTSARRVVAGSLEIESLERLAALHKNGHLTDDEFKTAKSRILARL